MNQEKPKEIKIVRKYDKVIKRHGGEYIIKIGQDSQGNCYGYCTKCNVNMIPSTDFDLKKHLITRSLLCPQCKYNLRL
jgi:hypothetical protein